MNSRNEVDAAIAVALAFVFGVALSLALSGCGNGALQINATVARAMLEVQAASGPVIRDARIDAAVDAARAVHDAGGDEPAALVAAQATAERWQCAIEGHRLYSGGVGAYVDALVLWGAGAEFQLTDALPFVFAALDAYRSIVSCLRSLGSSALPDVPAFMNLIPSEWSLER